MLRFGDSQAEVFAEAKRLEEKLEEGPASGATFWEFAQLYHDLHNEAHAPAARERERIMIANLTQHLGDRRMNKIGAEDVAKYGRSWLESGRHVFHRKGGTQVNDVRKPLWQA